VGHGRFALPTINAKRGLQLHTQHPTLTTPAPLTASGPRMRPADRLVCCRNCVVCMCKAGDYMCTCARQVIAVVHGKKQGDCSMHAWVAVMRHCAQSRSYLSMPCPCMCLADVSSVDRRTVAVILQQPNPPPPEDAQQHTNATTHEQRRTADHTAQIDPRTSRETTCLPTPTLG
jgi:hypothetical protein